MKNKLTLFKVTIISKVLFFAFNDSYLDS